MASSSPHAATLKFCAVVAIVVTLTFAGFGDDDLSTSWISLAIVLVIASALASDAPSAAAATDPGVWALAAVLAAVTWARVFMAPHRALMRSAVSADGVAPSTQAQTSSIPQDGSKTLP